MKHWGELTELESAIIRVGEFKNLFKLLVAGAENDVDMKVVQSAIYTLEGMIDDIDSTLYEKFETVFSAVRDESFREEEQEYELNISTMNDAPVTAYGSDTFTVSPSAYKSSIVDRTSIEEEEAFKELEKAIRNWHKATP